MRKLKFLAVITAVVAFAFVACNKEEFRNEPPPSTHTHTNTHTIEYVRDTLVIRDSIRIPFEVPVYIYTEKIPKGKPTLTYQIDCATNTIHFRIETVFTDPRFDPEVREFSYKLRNSTWGEEPKNVLVCSLDLKKEGFFLETDPSYPENIGDTIVSVRVNKKFTQKFTQGVETSVYGEEEHIWIPVHGFLFGPFSIESNAELVSYDVSKNPKGELSGKDIYPATFDFRFSNSEGCSSSITNEMNLLMKKKPVVIVRYEDRKYWFELQKRNSCWSAFLPSCYESYIEVWAIYSDGSEEPARKESAKGSLAWDMATSSCQYLTASQFSGLQLIENFIKDGISLGTNERSMPYKVTVGGVPERFKAKPTFEWNKLKNTLETSNATTKVNKTGVRATCNNSGKGEAFDWSANTTFYKKADCQPNPKPGC